MLGGSGLITAFCISPGFHSWIFIHLLLAAMTGLPEKQNITPIARPQLAASAIVQPVQRDPPSSMVSLRVKATEFLHPLSRVDLGCVKVAATVYRDVMNNVELSRHASRTSKARQSLRALTIDHS